jgi:hypothetical protein
MAKRADDLSAFVHHVRFVGRAEGLVKTLRGFKKSHHTVPDAVNAATSAFLGKLCEGELADEAEAIFQRVRGALAYKRKDLTLDLASPTAVLSAKDFVFDLVYSLDGDNPASYTLVRSLHSLRNGDLVATPEFDALFAAQFSELAFVLTKGAPVEAVIDAIENLEDSPLAVDYPSDWSVCTLSIPDVSAQVRFNGAELTMVFLSTGSPRELLEAFLAVRHAFALTKHSVLSALLR